MMEGVVDMVVVVAGEGEVVEASWQLTKLYFF